MKRAKGLKKARRELTKAWLQYKWPIIAAVVFVGLLLLVNSAVSQYEAWIKEQAAGQLQAASERIVQGFATTYRQRLKNVETKLGLEALGRRAVEEGGASVTAALGETAAATDQLLGARYVPLGASEVDRTTNPPLGYAALEMVRRVEETGKAVRPEVLFFGSENQQLTALYPLRDKDALVGYVLAGYDLSLLKGPLQANAAALGNDVYVELRQPVAKGRPLKLAIAGDPGLRQGPAWQRRPVSGTGFRLAIWQRPHVDGAAISYYVWGGAGLIALLGLGGFIIWRRREQEAAEPVYDGAAARIVVRDEVDDGVLSRLDSPGVDDFGSGPPPLPEVDEGIPATLDESAHLTFDEDVEDSVFGDLDAHEKAAPSHRVPTREPASELAPESESEPLAASVAASAALPPSSVFRAYDVRGVIGDDFGTDQFFDLGRAIGSEAYDRGQQTIVVARDGRLSSPGLHEAVIRGLRETGRDVIDIGLVPTPLLYFATYYLNTGSGVMVTASHNPPPYNGLKVMLGGETLSGDEVSGLRARLEQGKFSTGEGNYQEMDLLSEYIRRVSEDIPVALGSAYRLVLDCGNGAAGPVAPKLFRALGHDVIELYCDVDGAFPNHDPDTSDPQNVEDLVAAVKENGADLGFGFDGDGDRLVVVDAGGNIILPDRLMMLYARDILSRIPESKIVYDVKCSSRLGVIISKLGGTPIMWKTGHSYLKKKLKEESAELAGDFAGHFFFEERWYGFDDAMYAAARLLEILMGMKSPPAEILSKLPTGVTTPEIRVELPEGENFRFMESFSSSVDIPDAKITTIDGVRADFSDGWGLVRASNTTPALTFRFEAQDDEALARIKAQFRALIGAVNPEIVLPF